MWWIIQIITNIITAAHPSAISKVAFMNTTFGRIWIMAMHLHLWMIHPNLRTIHAPVLGLDPAFFINRQRRNFHVKSPNCPNCPAQTSARAKRQPCHWTLCLQHLHRAPMVNSTVAEMPVTRLCHVQFHPNHLPAIQSLDVASQQPTSCLSP